MLRTYIDWLLDVPVVGDDAGSPRSGRSAPRARRGSLRPRQGQGAHRRVPGRPEAEGRHEGARSSASSGPPGVGKTSLGQSIARAMSRKFVRISLGGVRDEAEIRGHRRTYIGSIPGRIVQALKQAGSMNPVFMLDEIDKMSAGFQGDPAAALLEVLDPAQNHSFRDHYLEAPVDLSQGALHRHGEPAGHRSTRRCSTAWRSSRWPATARRRSCTSRGKYLLPRQMTEHGLPPDAMEITDAALRTVIAEYTREAGVRNLERQLGTIARKVAARIATRPADAPPAAARRSSTAPRWTTTWARRGSRRRWRSGRRRPGVATGLAWTETGGDVLFIEATLLPGGNQNIILTGQLGNVMQESARAALSHIRAQRRGAWAFRRSFSRSTTCTCTCRPARFRRTDRRPASRWRRPSCRRRATSRCGRTWR